MKGDEVVPGGLEEVRFVLFSSVDPETYQRALEGVDSAGSS